MTSRTVDGDDYTWESLPGGAVLNSASHTVCEVCGAPATEILYGTVPAGDQNGWRLFKPGIQHCYCARCAAAAHVEPLDLHTPDQKLRELQAEVWRLKNLLELMTTPLDVALRVDNLVDAVEMLGRRVAAIEQGMATLKCTLERVFEIRL